MEVCPVCGDVAVETTDTFENLAGEVWKDGFCHNCLSKLTTTPDGETVERLD